MLIVVLSVYHVMKMFLLSKYVLAGMILVGMLVILFIDLPYSHPLIVLMTMRMKKKDSKCFSALGSLVKWVIVEGFYCRLVLNKVTVCFLWVASIFRRKSMLNGKRRLRVQRRQ